MYKVYKDLIRRATKVELSYLHTSIHISCFCLCCLHEWCELLETSTTDRCFERLEIVHEPKNTIPPYDSNVSKSSITTRVFTFNAKDKSETGIEICSYTAPGKGSCHFSSSSGTVRYVSLSTKLAS